MKMFRLYICVIMLALLTTGCLPNNERIGEVHYVRTEAKDYVEVYDKIDDIVLEKMTLDDIISLLGEPDEYTWDHLSYDYSILPSRYLMVYSNILNIHILDGNIVEIQIFGEDYETEGGLRVGMKSEAFEKVIAYNRVVKNGDLEFVNKTYYKDIRGIKGKCFFEEDGMRIHIYEDEIVSIYFTSDNLGIEEKMYAKLIGGFNNNLLWKDIYGISFLTDSRVLGKWTCVDYVDSPDGYDASLQYTENLMYSYMEFLDRRVEITLNPDYNNLKLEDYVLNGELFWSRGYIFNNKRKTASEYFIYEVDGKQHLFVQDREWNYSLYGVKPKYYIFTQTE